MHRRFQQAEYQVICTGFLPEDCFFKKIIKKDPNFVPSSFRLHPRLHTRRTFPSGSYPLQNPAVISQGGHKTSIGEDIQSELLDLGPEYLKVKTWLERFENDSRTSRYSIPTSLWATKQRIVTLFENTLINIIPAHPIKFIREERSYVVTLTPNRPHTWTS